ncbi:hypothetical protein Tco_0977748 [Tanacetum coccineum]|uniref:Uncharacterized protein n=1 Tax=Tanacetum coccineum TaxID=301880 RepID=A0ABQ5EKY5_9ASTR
MAALKYKDDHNKIAYLGRERGCEDFTDILGYLDHSPLRYALTHAPPVVFDSLVKQFWATAVVRPNAAGSHDLVATIDDREVVVTESLIRTQLHFDDANGIFDMPIPDILEGMRVIGYPTDGTLTFLKNHLSPQWRFLVHTLMHCLSPKSGSWNQFPSSIATALICLSTGRVYNFSRFILEGMIGNLKAKQHKFLMYPRFLQMIVALETADRTPRPTFDFTRKMFANMKFKWEGQPIPLTTPMLAIAAAGNDAAGGDDAANEDNAAANEAAGSAAEAHLVPHSPPVSPVREPTPEQQPVSQRPSSPSPTIPETEWVVPNPVSPVTDWRPWPYVPVHSPIRDPTPEPESPPTPPAQTFIFEEPLVFGPEPRPAGYVDPDVIEPIIFGPQPRPHGYVDPDFVEPIIFGPQPRPDNYLEPEDLDNIISMEDDTTHGGFHVESPVRPDDAPTPTADAAGRAEDPALLTGLSAKLDRCMGRIDSLETELGKSKKIMGGAILTLVSRVKKLEKTVKQLRETRLVVDASAAEGDVDIQDDIDLDGLSRMASTALGHDQPAVPSEDVEEREEEEVPLRRKRSAYRRARTEFSTPAFEQFQANLSAGVLPHTAVPEPAGPSVAADKGKAPLPELDIPAEFVAEDAQAMERFLFFFFEEETDARKWNWTIFMMRMERTDWVGLNLNVHVGSNPALARELLGADVTEENFIERMTAIKERKKRALFRFTYRSYQGDALKGSLVECSVQLFRPSLPFMEHLLRRQRVERASSQPASVPAATTHTADDPDSAVAMDSAGSHREIGVSPFADSAASSSPSNVSTDHMPLMSRVAADPDRLMNIQVLSVLAEINISVVSLFGSESESDDDIETYIPPLPYGEFKDWEMVSCPLGNSYIHVYHQQNRRRKYFTYLKQLLPHVYREDILLLRRRMNRYFRLNPDVNIGLDLWRDVNMLCQSLHSDDVEDFWRTQDEWIVSCWKLYPKSSVHVLDLTNGKTVYMFVDKFNCRATQMLERMLSHSLTVPPSYCRDVVIAGNIIQTVQTGLRQSYECLASAPIVACPRGYGALGKDLLKSVDGVPGYPKLVWFSLAIFLFDEKVARVHSKAHVKDFSQSVVVNKLLKNCMVIDSPYYLCYEELASPEQTDTGKDVSNPLYGCDSLPKTVRTGSCWSLMLLPIDSAVHRVHAVSFDAAVASTVSVACWFYDAAAYFVSAAPQSSCS